MLPSVLSVQRTNFSTDCILIVWKSLLIFLLALGQSLWVHDFFSRMYELFYLSVSSCITVQQHIRITSTCDTSVIYQSNTTVFRNLNLVVEFNWFLILSVNVSGTGYHYILKLFIRITKAVQIDEIRNDVEINLKSF